MFAAKGGLWLDFEKRTDKWIFCNNAESHICYPQKCKRIVRVFSILFTNN
jgi:hypothetical protein